MTKVDREVLARVEEQAKRLSRARRNLDAELGRARELAIELLDANAISENQLAERLGVNRSTIREWSRNR